jgi:hypothetical protein
MLGENNLRLKGGYNPLISPKQHLSNILSKNTSIEKGEQTN